MINLQAPELQFRRFSLIEDTSRTTRRGIAKHAKPKHLNGWAELSEAASMPITVKLVANDPELIQFAQGQADKYRFDYVTFGCSFGPADDEAFDRAWVEVDLSSPNRPMGAKPIAWSVSPREAFDEVEVTKSGKLGGKFELLTGEVGYERSRKLKEYFLRAFRERQSNPYWEFRGTDRTRLAGSYRLHLVVRSELSERTKGCITLSVTVRRRRFVLFSSVDALDGTTPVEFQLPA